MCKEQCIEHSAGTHKMNRLRLESLLRHGGLLDQVVLLLLAEVHRVKLKVKVEGVTPIPTPLETLKVLM